MHVNRWEIVKKNERLCEKKFRILLPIWKDGHIGYLWDFAIRPTWRQVVIYWVMLRVHLSDWNYSFYLGRFRKFISLMDSVGYRISYKIVKNTCNIIRYSLGTPGVGLQDGKSLLKGHSITVAFFLSPRRSDIMIITSPFALRPW